MKDDKLMAHDPLSDADAILTEEYYGRRARTADAAPDRLPRRTPGPVKPTHYKVICISMYTRDIEELEAKVAELKRRGWTKASKSQLIRLALSQIDLDKLATPRQ
jgi:tRNA G10  N-methylase Trm11